MASFFSSLLLLLLIVTALAVVVEARVRNYTFHITYQYRSPDCFQKLAVTINGQTPGPTIIAEQGDTIAVEVKNGMFMENTVIHWHGIRQIGTPWSDGAEGITQCPILPGETFVYKFVVDRAGTYSYHAHTGLQRSAGLYGLINVAVPKGVVEPFSYDYERNIILNDWWHKSTNDQAVGLASKPITFVGEPQSLLINGRGRFDCSVVCTTEVCNLTNPECSPPSVFTVIPGKTYRFRILCITSLSAVNFAFEGHNMTVVEADGYYVKPFAVDNLYLYSGETYSVIVKADQDPSRNYWAALNVVSRKPRTPTGVAILNYGPNHPSKAPPTVPPAGPPWNDTMSRFNQSLAIRAHPDYIEPPPSTSDRTIILLNAMGLIDGDTRWALNNISLAVPDTPYLIALKYKLENVVDPNPPPESYDYKSYDIHSIPSNPNAITSSSSIYRLDFNSTVDVILQNANTLNPNDSETHPWHLHGHDFWVLGYGLGKFDPSSVENFNLVDPIRKNSVPLHPYGWTALRFRADNPGVWAFHCHIEAHFFEGMGVVFEEGVEKVGRLPSSIMGCGKSRTLA